MHVAWSYCEAACCCQTENKSIGEIKKKKSGGAQRNQNQNK